MNKPQYLALVAALVVFLGLYLGFQTTPSAQKAVERSRSLTGESTGFETLVESAKAGLVNLFGPRGRRDAGIIEQRLCIWRQRA